MVGKNRWNPLIPLAVLLLASLACSVFTGGKGGATAAATEGAATNPPWTRERMGSPLPGGKTGLPDGATAEAATPRPDAGGDGGYLGDYFDTEGYYYAALEIADPAEPGPIYEPVDGMRLVGVRIVVGNRDGEQLYFSVSDVALQDGNGDLWEAEFAALDWEIISAAVDPGESVEGWLGFTIPEDVRPAALKYLYDFINDRSVVVPLAEPPAGRTARTVDTSRSPTTGSKLGQTASGSGFSITAFQIEDPAEPAFPDFFDPPAETRLAAVEIEVKNVSDEKKTFSTFEIYLVDSNGRLYAIDYFNGPDVIESGDLEPGAKVRGWVTFLVPDGAMLESIKFVTFDMDAPLYAGLG